MTVLPTFTTAQIFTASAANNMANSGMVYITKKTFSATATLDCTNVFSSQYDNYAAIIALSPTPGGSIVRGTMLSGTTPSAVNYDSFESGNIWAGTADTTPSPSAAYWFALRSATYIYAKMEIFNPYVYNVYTTFQSEGVDDTQSWQARGVHRAVPSYDGIRFYNASGNMTGDITFYGYRKA